MVQQRSGPVDGTSAPGGIKVSDPSDRFEREAAANAERVMAGARRPAPTAVRRPARGAAARGRTRRKPVQGLFVQRQGEEEEEEPVQGLFVQREGEEEEEEAAPAT